ncbi:hypothetical protein AAZX31_U003500 [Glycine max]
MEGKLLHVSTYSFVFLLFLSFKQHVVTKAQSPNYVGDDCQNTTQQKALSSAYQTNLNSLLSWLSTDAATSKGYNHNSFGNNTPGGDDSAVYGLYNCRGDVVGYFCQFCVSTASREVLQRCPNRVSAIVLYDFCILRYSNENFFGNVTVYPSWHAVQSKNVSSKEEIQKGLDFMRGLIRKATVETNLLYYMDGFNLSSTQKRYGLVQCSRDLTSDGCRECLEAMLAQVPKCCEQNLGWQVLAASCLIKYDDYIFYLFRTQASDTQTAKKRGASKSRIILIIGLSVLGALALLCFSVYCFWFRKRSRRGRGRGKDGRIPDTIDQSSYHNVQTEETLNVDLPTIPLITILKSTDNFSEASKLGEGGFGPVYKGTLPDGRQIAVKRLSQASGQGSEEFKNEVMFIAKLQHCNLVRLLACCLEGNEKILVYEYLSNASLDFHLFDERKKRQLDWNLRLSIINGIAKGLLYLHEDSRLKVIHRDLKASNILLDDEMNPKISDFGLARAFEKGQNQANTNRVMGTYGYMSPEYAMEGLFSVKSDVFSYGVLVLEIICGKKNSGFYLSECGQSLTLYAWKIWCAGKSLELMDPVLEKSCIESEVMKCIHIGLLCVQEDAADRPTMSTVVVMLASDKMSLPEPNQPAFSVGRMTLEGASTSKSSKNLSINDVTVTNILPR